MLLYVTISRVEIYIQVENVPDPFFPTPNDKFNTVLHPERIKPTDRDRKSPDF